MSNSSYMGFRLRAETLKLKISFVLVFLFGGVLCYLATDSLVPFAEEAVRNGEAADASIPQSASELLDGMGVRFAGGLFVYQMAAGFTFFVALMSARYYSNLSYHWLASDLATRQRLYLRETGFVSALALTAAACTIVGSILGMMIQWPDPDRGRLSILAPSTLANLALAFAGVVVCYLGFGLLGMVAAHLTRSVAASIALAVLLPLFVEPLVVAQADWGGKVLPATILVDSARAILRDGIDAAGLLRSLVVCSLLALVGLARFTTAELK